jgi:hypothetical protein
MILTVRVGFTGIGGAHNAKNMRVPGALPALLAGSLVGLCGGAESDGSTPNAVAAQ